MRTSNMPSGRASAQRVVRYQWVPVTDRVLIVNADDFGRSAA
jgi:hypothetical protein